MTVAATRHVRDGISWEILLYSSPHRNIVLREIRIRDKSSLYDTGVVELL